MNREQEKRLIERPRTPATERTRGVPGKDLLRFAGTIDAEDLKLMEQAIEEDCEVVENSPIPPRAQSPRNPPP
jgi:hypothetical protein